MKTERISIFNYEAFYLDHLEGNLSDKDTALLMTFLDENPELQMEDDSMPSLFAEDITLSRHDKNELKQTDDDEVITAVNVEYFMIAEVEGILSNDKQNELAAFIEIHPELEKERAVFNALTLSPNLYEVYTDKNGLKKKTIVLWPYISIAAAASVIIAFFLLTNSGTEVPSNLAVDPQDQNKEEKQIEPIDELPQIALQVKDESEVQNSARNAHRNTPVQHDLVLPNQMANADDNKVSPLNRRPVRNLLPSLEGYEIQPITTAIASYVREDREDGGSNAYAANTGIEHMTDPIQGVTSRLNKRMKKDVDFRTAKATKDQSGGFYLKIGKFELLRKKHR
ncbi:MAG: hypothetical protein ACI837_003165 [Crocinitomicaceae bacterium]|jgi:hypothetical protein